MNLRIVEFNDLINLYTCNVSNLPENYTSDFWCRMILEYPRLSFLAEDENGKVVGYVLSSMEKERDSDSSLVGYINSLCVLRPYRRLGIGQKLMNLTKDAMLRQEAHLEFIQLHVRKSNKAARSLYSKLGFKQHLVDVKYYGEEDALIMRLYLVPNPTRPRRWASWLNWGRLRKEEARELMRHFRGGAQVLEIQLSLHPNPPRS